MGTSPYPERRQSSQFPASGGGYRGGQYEPAPYQGPERRGTSRVLIAVVVVILLIVIAGIVWAVGLHKSPPATAGGSTGTSHSKTGHSVTAQAAVLTPAGVTTFNPLSKTTPGNTEDASTAANAIADNGSAWATSDYFGSPVFGGLKTGVGLLIDMGKAVKLSQVEVTFGPGVTKAEIYLGNSGPSLAKSSNALSSFQLVSGLASATGKHTFQVSSNATGRYVLNWLTSLPRALNPPAAVVAQANGQKIYEGLLSDVVVRGTAVSAAH
jgi:putative peptidoglycan lipid II flippase